MNDRNRRLNASDERERARRVMAMAEYALSQGIHEEAVSSAYYAAHHAARALLFSLGLEVRSHDGLRSLLAEHFERPGHLPHGSVRTMKGAFDDRMEADYGVRVHFSRDKAAGAVAWARDFLAAASAHLGPFLASLPDDGGPSKVREPRVRYRKAPARPSRSLRVRKPKAKG